MFKRVFKLPVLLGAALLATTMPAVQSYATPDTPTVDDGLKVTVVGATEIGVYAGDTVHQLAGTSVTLKVKNCYLTDPAEATRDQRVDIQFQQSAYYNDNVNRHSIGVVHNQVMHLYRDTTKESDLKGGLNHFDVTVTLPPGLYTGSVYCHDAGDQSRNWQEYFYVPEGSLEIHGVGGGVWKPGEEAVISSEKGTDWDGKNTFGVLASRLQEEKRHPASVTLIYPDGREEKLGDFKPDDKGHLELPKRMLPSKDAGLYTIKAVQNWVVSEPDSSLMLVAGTDKPKVDSMPITLTTHYFVLSAPDPGEVKPPKDDPKDKPKVDKPKADKPKADKPKKGLPKTGW